MKGAGESYLGEKGVTYSNATESFIDQDRTEFTICIRFTFLKNFSGIRMDFFRYAF